ncbi:MAG TPA: hypothetical protein VER32_15670 [Pyrinomonadaceae bacterium]|nr:hypothetical protein [Pyrinomonadaceae bacterium]
MRTTLTAVLFAACVAACAPDARAQTQPTPVGPPAVAQRPTPTPYPIVVVADASVRAGWQRYQFGASPAFSVAMPARPEANAERMPTAPDAVVHFYLTASERGVYGASRLDGLALDMDGVTEAQRESFFREYVTGFGEGFRQGLKASNLDYELSFKPSKKVRAAGREAFEQDMTVGPFQGRAQLVFAGHAAYCVVAVWTAETPAADYQAFFDSFRLGAR